ncbi:hypothetical protein RIF29_09344 [Crotalaria pallida]|uniref:Uncharacterized protein n=1 Tax=Crotalaria pallida TaxID=3830 RepID=A0AAN9FRQ9_CROPI
MDNQPKTPPGSRPPPPPPPPPSFPLQQPPTRLKLSSTLPITITVAATTTVFPITFTVTPDSLSTGPIDATATTTQQDPPPLKLHLLPLHLLRQHQKEKLYGHTLPTGPLTAPTVITIATNTIFIMIDVFPTGTVLFTPLANTTGVSIAERKRPFGLSNLTTTYPIELPIILAFNVVINTNTTIVISISISAKSIVIISNTVSGASDYVVYLANDATF